MADDDWMAATYLYSRSGRDKPPVTLLVVSVGDNSLFDPIHEELKVADSILAIGVGPSASGNTFQMLSMRMVDTPARDTMRGVPKAGTADEGTEVAGVWKPKLGGIRSTVLKNIVKAVLSGGIAQDVMDGLDGFVRMEHELDSKRAK
jgi:exosome complex component RRP42